MAVVGVRRKLVAIIAADVVGYSRLMAANDEATVGRLRQYREIMDGLIARHEGRSFGAAGDSLMAEFPSAVEAVRCALEIQEEVAARNARVSPETAMRLRIGICVGEAIVEDGNLYGDGVNIAARLQEIAGPGGIVMSASAHEQTKNRISARIEPLGPRSLKNIPEPVGVFRIHVLAQEKPAPQVAAPRAFNWRWRAATGAAAVAVLAGGFAVWDVFFDQQSQVRAFAAEAAQPLPKEPSIAVLPFVNASGNETYDYFGDGVTEDIITNLTKVSGLFVVGRDSSFSYKGKAVQAKKIGRDLGVRYVLQGSVRRDDGRVRVSTYLVDAATDRTLWAEQHDRVVGDIFAMQGEIAEKVVLALAVSFRPGERDNLHRQYAQNFDSYDLFLKARAKFSPPSKENLLESQRLFGQAVVLDSAFVGGYAGVSLTHSIAVMMGHSSFPPTDIEEAEKYAKMALSKSASSYGMAQFAMANALLLRRQPDEAVAFAEAAQRSYPGDAFVNATLGMMLTFSGRAKDALGPIDTAIRLERSPTPRTLFFKMFAAYTDKNYEEAAKAHDEFVKTGSECGQNCLAYAAAAKLQLAKNADAAKKRNLEAEATALAKELDSKHPNFINRFWSWLSLHKNAADAKRIWDEVEAALKLART